MAVAAIDKWQLILQLLLSFIVVVTLRKINGIAIAARKICHNSLVVVSVRRCYAIENLGRRKIVQDQNKIGRNFINYNMSWKIVPGILFWALALALVPTRVVEAKYLSSTIYVFSVSNLPAILQSYSGNILCNDNNNNWLVISKIIHMCYGNGK